MAFLNPAENFNIARKITMDFLRQDRSSKRSIAKNRFLATLNDQYLATVIGLKPSVI